MILLDEPTTALTPTETSQLFGIIRRLAQRGITFVFISHLLDELMELCDEISRSRDGSLAGHLARGQYDTRTLAELIAGHVLDVSAPKYS